MLNNSNRPRQRIRVKLPFGVVVEIDTTEQRIILSLSIICVFFLLLVLILKHNG